MKFARIYLNGEPKDVDAPTFLRIKEAQQESCCLPSCIECGQRVFLNDELGAKGFRIVADELVEHGRQPKMPGFSHFKNNANQECSLYFADDPRFQAIHRKNNPDSLEKERNLTVLSDPAVRSLIVDVQTYFVRGLTGIKQISNSDKDILARIEQKCVSWTGLGANPWILGYIGPVLLGSRKREYADGERQIFYKSTGEQRLAVQAVDGSTKHLCIPQKISPHVNFDGGRRAEPVLRDGRPIEFIVSFAEAAMIAERAVANRREAARRASVWGGKAVQLDLFRPSKGVG